MRMSTGIFLSLEGVDGAGKSTHIQWLCEQIEQLGHTVVCTREPGGTELGELLRELLLHQPMHLRTEALLMFAARNEHIEQVIKPALAQGKWVLCDRFTDATFAYQGGGRQLESDAIAALERWVHPQLQPHRTWLFDLPLDVAKARLMKSRDLDRFEREHDAFFERTRAAYLQRAREHSMRFKIVDSSQSVVAIQNELKKDLLTLQSVYCGVS